ncbi:unnamed protein product [Orchesella dallaii]|uniref:DNA polymerase alpha subunit B n=1 Tax=Orchesella dallaii TaxID=48710 RepID=A0ABP1RND4_9HEXA
MGDLIEKLQDEFDEMAYTVGSNAKGIERNLTKCETLCTRYNVGPTEFVEMWMAFAATESLEELSEKDLDVFEKRQLSSLKETISKSVQNDQDFKFREESKVQIFGQSTTYDVEDSDNDMDDDANDVLQAYASNFNGTPKVEKKRVARLRQKRGETPTSTGFGLQGYSPAVEAMSTSYSTRTRIGDSLLRYKCKDSDYWNDIPVNNDSVKVFPAHASQNMMMMINSASVYKYMFQKATDMASTLNFVIEDLGYEMLNEEETELFDLRVPSVEDCWYLGQVLTDEGRLSQGNICLQGDLETSGGQIVSLDLSNADEYRLFPGQVVMINGRNEGKCLRVSKVRTPSPSALPQILPGTTRPLNIIVACGPYTPSDSMQYEPLKDLLKVVKRDKPDVCILIGPFLDSSHPLIVGGDIADTFDVLFENLMNFIRDSLEDLKTHFVLIPSCKDAHQHPVFPTPPYSVKFVKQMTVLPDPALLEVCGITIGATSMDVLKHLANNEIAKSTIADRMGGLSKLLLSQRNFYPLYPPDESVPFDVQLWSKYCKFAVTPHLLILPSDLRYFIKEVDGTIIVNPERLMKGKGGTYIRLQVKLPEPLGDNISSIADFCCGEILKI